MDTTETVEINQSGQIDYLSYYNSIFMFYQHRATVFGDFVFPDEILISQRPLFFAKTYTFALGEYRSFGKQIKDAITQISPIGSADLDLSSELSKIIQRSILQDEEYEALIKKDVSGYAQILLDHIAYNRHLEEILFFVTGASYLDLLAVKNVLASVSLAFSPNCNGHLLIRENVKSMDSKLFSPQAVSPLYYKDFNTISEHVVLASDVFNGNAVWTLRKYGAKLLMEAIDSGVNVRSYMAMIKLCNEKMTREHQKEGGEA